MRGIEAAFKILTENLNEGRFASEALRNLANREKMKASDISLASSLIYIFMRRRELWEEICGKFLSSKEKLPSHVNVAMIMGAGGILELRRFSVGVLINGIIEILKRSKSYSKYCGLVNAVLRKIIENGETLLNEYKNSPALEQKALWAGIPVWTLPAWNRTWNKAELKEIFTMFNSPSYSSLRISKGKTEEVTKILEDEKIRCHVSEISGALRLNESVLPVNLKGFNEGLFTVQSESSILTASLVKKFYDNKGIIIDMCSGRGVKAGQILQDCEKASMECWELSERRSQSAAHELERLHVNDRAKLKQGNALTLEPDKKPSFVILDAPCSCSGTWNRKPESKWRLDWKKFDALVATEKKLLEKAVNICETGGYILYITCSLLKQENENVIAEISSAHSELTEVSSLIDWKIDGKIFHKGKPYGIYIWPCNSWLDGFYCSLIMKR